MRGQYQDPWRKSPDSFWLNWRINHLDVPVQNVAKTKTTPAISVKSEIYDKICKNYDNRPLKMILWSPKILKTGGKKRWKAQNCQKLRQKFLCAKNALLDEVDLHPRPFSFWKKIFWVITSGTWYPRFTFCTGTWRTRFLAKFLKYFKFEL